MSKQQRNKTGFKILSDIKQIKEELSILDVDVLKDALKDDKEYLLIEKLISFADIPTFGKCKYLKSDKNNKKAFSTSSIKQRIKQNYLFYNSNDEMYRYEIVNKKEQLFFCQTKQSNIYMPNCFYDFLGIPNARKKENINLNEGNYRCVLVNSTIEKYFLKEITDSTLKNLGRTYKAKDVVLSQGEFTNIDLHVKVHGIGTATDNIFHLLRGNIFAKDKLVILLEKKDKNYKLYIMLYRNPRFFEINKMLNKDYLISLYGKDEYQTIEESRVGQAKWRNQLAELEIASNCVDDDKIVCPISNIKVKYPNEAALLRASHIKAYAKCKTNGKINISEAYDVNNGLLLTANVDALFDRYLLSIDPKTGDIVFSKLISNILIEELKLNKRISEKYLSSDRIKYIQEHYNEFLMNENAR